MNDICGRVTEIEALEKALCSPSSNLEIIGISGYGGVGKTYLLNHVIDRVRPENAGRLVLWIDGAAKGLSEDFMRILSEMLAPQHLRGLGKSVKKDFFPSVRKLQTTFAAEREGLLAAIQKKGRASATPGFDRIKEAVLVLIQLGNAFNRLAGKGGKGGRESLRDAKLEDCAEKAFDLIQPYVEDTSLLPAPLQDLFGITYKRKVRTQLFDVAADALITDLTAMLVGYQKQDWAKYTPDKIKGFDRLLLVVDDFEVMGKTLAPFLLGHLLPALRTAKFPTQVVVLGRDALPDTDPGFEHHFASNTRLQLRLNALSPHEAMQMLKKAGYTDARAKEINDQCKGLPFLLTAFADGRNQDALFYQRFHDRTTRWMTDVQKEWFLNLCYLDQVNRDTVSAMMPETDAGAVVDWFRHEASIRDDAAQCFRVKPLIREMVLQHHRNELGRTTQEVWMNRGKASST
jgi:hypothetical protein